jgi:hypothetical protein
MRCNRATLAVICASVLAILAPTGAQAQHFRIYRPSDRYFAVPGASMRIYPPPCYTYRMGTMTVYSYWPYGYPPTYQWPYGSTTRVYVQPFHHRRHHWHSHGDW